MDYLESLEEVALFSLFPDRVPQFMKVLFVGVEAFGPVGGSLEVAVDETAIFEELIGFESVG